MSRLRALLLGAAVSIVAAAWLVMTTDIGQVAAQLGRAQVAWLAPGLLVLALQAWVRSARWAWLIRTCAGIQIGIARVIDAMLLGYFVNAVVPGRLGEVARAIVVARRESVAFKIGRASCRERVLPTV